MVQRHGHGHNQESWIAIARKALTILVGTILLAGCLAPPSYQVYNDPRELLGTADRDTPFKLGVLYTPNTIAALSYLATTREEYLGWGINSYDPATLENGIHKILANRFNETIRVKSADDALNKNVDLILILDMQITAAHMSGKKTIIDIKCIFMGLDSTELSSIQVHGEKTIPYPAFSVYDNVVHDVLQKLVDSIDQDKQLEAKLNELEQGPTLPPAPAPSAPVFSDSDQTSRVALVIGNSAYRSGALRNPVHDATDIASRLKKAGFSVILLRNANQRTMANGVNRLWTELRKGGIGMFYYAGHAMQVNGRNYLIPIGADIRSESDITYEAMDVGRVLGKMEDAGNSLNIVVLDACRNNPFARSFRSPSIGLAMMDAPRGSLIAYSTSPGDVAEDGSGRNGTYTKHLLRHLLTPDITIEDVLKRVRIDVSKETDGQQIPWESSSLTGYFYFMTSQ